MPNIAVVLKEEIARVARKELRDEVLHLRKTLTAHRTDIAALKRRSKELEQIIRQLQQSMGKPAAQAAEPEASGALRFSAKRLAAQRQRLGLSAADFGLLVGASGQSIYKWEEGKVRPRAGQLQAIAAVRGLSKRQAAARLAELKAGGEQAPTE